MELLADAWVLNMVIWLLCVLGLVYYRQNMRRRQSTFTTAEDFSVRTIFFSFQKGEADLFIGFLVGMFAFSLFVLGITRWISNLLG